jgi:hypothetical protein
LADLLRAGLLALTLATARVVLGDSLGALRHGVLGQLTRKNQSHGGLHLARRDGVLLAVVSKTAGLSGEALKDIVHERVHDDHGLLGDTGVGVHLLEHLVDVGGVRGSVGLLSLLVLVTVGLGGSGLLGCGGLLGLGLGLAGSGALGSSLGSHWVNEREVEREVLG